MARSSSLAEPKLLFCAHCAGQPKLMDAGVSHSLPVQVMCPCGMQTALCRTAEIAIIIWNRRAMRKPPKKARRVRNPVLTPASQRDRLRP